MHGYLHRGPVKRRPFALTSRARGRGRGQAGQSLVEFALMLIFLTILLMGVLDLGRAFFTYLAMKDAAGDGAYFGTAFPQCVDANGINDNSAGCGQAGHTIDARTRDSAPVGGLVDWSTALVNVDLPCEAAPPGCDLDAGEVLTVTIQYAYQLITPFAGTFAEGNAITLTARSSAVIIRVPNCETQNPCR